MGDAYKMIKSKRGSAWIWILIILVLIGVGIGSYILLSGDSSPLSNLGGSSIPQPPALPY
jgi:flagellar basal body-associated protein FliL